MRLTDSTLVMGRAGYNAGVQLEGSLDVELHGVTIRSKNDVRNGASTMPYENVLLFLHGGAHAVLDRSRLEVDAGPEHHYAWAVGLHMNGANAKPTLIATSSVFWFKGFAGNWGASEGAPGVQDRRSNGNVMIHHFEPELGVFVNNTFLGNAGARAPAVNCLQSLTTTTDEACLGLSLLYGDPPAKFVFVNNYFATMYRLVWNNGSPDRYATFINNTVAPDISVVSDGALLDPTTDPAVLGDGHLQGGHYGVPDQLGEQNVTADCLLADPTNGDVHIAKSSPCVDSGAFDKNAPPLDIDGQPRPSGLAYDRGADEVVP
jgi:hypothetical protein